MNRERTPWGRFSNSAPESQVLRVDASNLYKNAVHTHGKYDKPISDPSRPFIIDPGYVLEEMKGYNHDEPRVQQWEADLINFVLKDAFVMVPYGSHDTFGLRCNNCVMKDIKHRIDICNHIRCCNPGMKDMSYYIKYRSDVGKSVIRRRD